MGGNKNRWQSPKQLATIECANIFANLPADGGRKWIVPCGWSIRSGGMTYIRIYGRWLVRNLLFWFAPSVLIAIYPLQPSLELVGFWRVHDGFWRVLAGSGGFTAGLCRVIWFWVLLALYSEGGGGFMNFFNQFNQFELTELVQICGLPVGLVVEAPKVAQIWPISLVRAKTLQNFRPILPI